METVMRPVPLHVSGFTLIELMIAVAVLGIIAAVALPSYNESIRKSRRTDAFTALSNVQQAQERWRANNPLYCDQLTAAATASPPGLAQSATTASSHYTISLDGVTATGYAVIATAISTSSQANDGSCARLRVLVAAGNILYGSATLTGAFDDSTTNRCWSR